VKAIVLTPPTTTLRLADVAEPRIATAQDLNVRVLQVGICGTDREEASGGRAQAPKKGAELVIGREMLGKVTEAGSAVKAVKPGDLAVFTVRRGCDECAPCRMNRSDMCLIERGSGTWIKELALMVDSIE
jgi:glucose 1-dehydrogenase